MLTTLRKNTSLLAALVLGSAAFSGAAMANEAPVFNNLGITYVNFDLGEDSLDGIGADIEATISDRLFFAGELFTVSESYSEGQGSNRISSKIDLTLMHANLGYQFFQNNGVVGYASAGLSSTRVKATVSSSSQYFSGSDSDSGFNAQLGVRARISSQVELDANIRHIDISGDSDLVATVGGRFKVAERFTVGLAYSHIDSDSSYYTVSLRYRF